MKFCLSVARSDYRNFQQSDTRADRGFARGPYRLFFYSADRDEPPHVHVEREEGKAKFWLEPVRLENSRGFGRSEIVRIERLVAENATLLLRSWHEYFGD
jgi:hypothetical protein